MDGFYNAASLSDRMKNPKNIGKGLVIGLIVTSIIYIAIAIATGLGADDGTVVGIFDRLRNAKAFFFITMLGIFFAVCSIINSFAILAKEILYELGSTKELKIDKIVSSKNEFINSLKVLAPIVAVFTLFTLLGCFFYDYGYGGGYYDTYSSKIYSLCDELSNMSTLFAFIGIILSILFYFIKNKKTPISFKIYALVSIVFFGLSYTFEGTRLMFNLIESTVFSIKNNIGFLTYILPSIIDFSLVIFIVILCFYPYKTPNNYNLQSKL